NSMKAAVKWSVIQRKRKLQRKEPGDPNLRDIYIINRIFAPSFHLSYRTRGGESVQLNEENLSELMYKDEVSPTKYLPKKTTSKKESSKNSTASLFPDL
ncbi:MAG TPA: hypothetical protein VFQ47_08550, partial [Nitrososphaera sp.]|nr:hypothetical protein [Nitrososphaera sp.]